MCCAKLNTTSNMVFLTKQQKTIATTGACVTLAIGTIGLANTIFGISDIKSDLNSMKSTLTDLRVTSGVIREKVDNLERKITRYESKLDSAGNYYSSNFVWVLNQPL
jgi:hypothetical protein